MKRIYTLIVAGCLLTSLVSPRATSTDALVPYLDTIKIFLAEFQGTDQRTFGQIESVIEPIIRRGQQLIEFVQSLPNDTEYLSQNVSTQLELVRNDAQQAAKLLRSGTQRQAKSPAKPERIDLYKIFSSVAELIEGLPNVIYCTIFVCKSSREMNIIDGMGEPHAEEVISGEEADEENVDVPAEEAEDPEPGNAEEGVEAEDIPEEAEVPEPVEDEPPVEVEDSNNQSEAEVAEVEEEGEHSDAGSDDAGGESEAADAAEESVEQSEHSSEDSAEEGEDHEDEHETSDEEREESTKNCSKH